MVSQASLKVLCLSKSDKNLKAFHKMKSKISPEPISQLISLCIYEKQIYTSSALF